MKGKIKKIIVVVTIIMLVGLILVNSTKAEVNDIEGKIGIIIDTYVKTGENITVKVTAGGDISEDNDGLLLEFDKTKLQFVSAKAENIEGVMIVVGNREKHPAGPDGVAIAMSSELEGNAKIPAGSTIATITFKTLEMSEGEQKVNLVHYKGNKRTEIISGVFNVVDGSEPIENEPDKNQENVEIKPQPPTENNTDKDQNFTNSTIIGPIQDNGDNDNDNSNNENNNQNNDKNNNQNQEKIVYEMLEGKDSLWRNESGKNLRFRSNADFSKFVSISIDGNMVDKTYYIAKSGSTIIEIKEAYLKTLKVGTHKISINSKDGCATANFKIEGIGEIKANRLPKTGSETDYVVIAISMVLIINMGISLVLYYKDK